MTTKLQRKLYALLAAETTTVTNANSDYPYGDVRRYGADTTGVVDQIASQAFQHAHDALPSTGGDIIVPPGLYKVDGTGATLAVPRILCSITKPSVRVLMSPGAKFLFQGMTAAALAAQNDGGAGANVFSGFVFGDGVIGGGVWGGYVLGDSDGTAITAGKSRAKFVAIDGADDVTVFGLKGKLVVGNIVNVRGSGSGLSAAQRNKVIGCSGESCAESAFNFQGGADDCIFSHNHSRLNQYHGFENGGDRVVCVGNHCCDNVSSGITQVGSHGNFSTNVCDGNTIHGMSASATTSNYNIFSNNVLTRNGQCGFVGIANTHDNQIIGNTLTDNGQVSLAGEGIKLTSGTRYMVKNNLAADTGGGKQVKGIDLINCINTSVIGNTTYGNVTFGFVCGSGEDNLRLMENDFGDTVSINTSGTNRYVRNNRGYITESGGSATITALVTSVTVTHNSALGAATTVASLSATPVSSLGTATKFWIDTLTSTTFNINVNAAPGLSVTFSWALDIRS